MKNTVKYILQGTLGFQRYLYCFALFKIKSLRSDKKEKDFFYFLSLMKDNEGLVFDVGANIGIMTYHLSKSLPNTTIVAIEPMPDNLKILKKVIENKGLTNVELHAEAVGENKGNVTMILPDNKGVKMQGLSHVKHDSIEEWNEGEEFTVPMTTIDEIAGNRKVQGIKMDVENFEYFSLQGASELIERDHPVIYLELWENENRMRCFNFLQEKGYKAYIVENGVHVVFDSEKHPNQNFIFIH